MLLTPTYHVFEMYKVHQGVAALQMKTDSQSYTVDGKEISEISASASKNAEGLLHISLCNVSHEDGAEVEIKLRGVEESKISTVQGRVLTSGVMDEHNTFDQPERVSPAQFDSFKVDGKLLTVTMPPMSVVILAVEQQ